MFVIPFFMEDLDLFVALIFSSIEITHLGCLTFCQCIYLLIMTLSLISFPSRCIYALISCIGNSDKGY